MRYIKFKKMSKTKLQYQEIHSWMLKLRIYQGSCFFGNQCGSYLWREEGALIANKAHGGFLKWPTTFNSLLCHHLAVRSFLTIMTNISGLSLNVTCLRSAWYFFFAYLISSQWSKHYYFQTIFIRKIRHNDIMNFL